MPDRVSRCFLPLTLIMFLLALTSVVDLDGTATQLTTVVSEPEKRGMFPAGTPHAPIVIDGDANFFGTALVQGWLGDGSPEDPYIIDGLDIDLGEERGHCIMISNTRVSFTISNCNLTGGSRGAGIHLQNVSNSELVNNTCYSNAVGIQIRASVHNTVANNTCNSNVWGIYIGHSNHTTVANNTCSSNDIGIYLFHLHSNTVVINTCINNRIGIYLYESYSNTVANNTCLDNTENDITEEFETAEFETAEFDPVVVLLIGLVGITLLGARWWKVSIRGDPDKIIIPTSYRLVSWFRKRRSLKHEDVDEHFEPDSSDQ